MGIDNQLGWLIFVWLFCRGIHVDWLMYSTIDGVWKGGITGGWWYQCWAGRKGEKKDWDGWCLWYHFERGGAGRAEDWLGRCNMDVLINPQLSMHTPLIMIDAFAHMLLAWLWCPCIVNDATPALDGGYHCLNGIIVHVQCRDGRTCDFVVCTAHHVHFWGSVHWIWYI